MAEYSIVLRREDNTISLSKVERNITVQSSRGGGTGGGNIISVNGQTGIVELTSADVGASPLSHSHSAGDVTGLALVATSGSYNDLSNKPTIPTVDYPVVSVAGKTGAVTLTKADVGLSNVDNTADLSKPISTATQTALDAKASTSHSHAQSDVTGLEASLNTKATQADIDSAVATKADSVHTHEIADTTGLQTAIDGKADTLHNHEIADVNGLDPILMNMAEVPTTVQKGGTNLGTNDLSVDIRSGENAIVSDQQLAFQANGAYAFKAPDASVDYVSIDATGISGNSTSTVRDILDPSSPQEAATKNYVDTADATLQTNIDGKADSGHSHNIEDLSDTTLTAPADGEVLTYDAGVWVNAPASGGGGGGQATYDAVVAPTGGDYTTLGSALASASNGWRIYIAKGTYTESALTTSLTDLTIEGAGSANSVLAFGANDATFSGARLRISNVGITMSTALLITSGAEQVWRNTAFTKTGAGLGWAFNPTRGVLDSSYIATTYDTPSNTLFQTNGQEATISNNQFSLMDSGGTNGAVRFINSSQLVTGNHFTINSGNNGLAIDFASGYGVFNGNKVEDMYGTNTSGTLIAVSNGATVSDNYFITYAQTAIDLRGGTNMITNNFVSAKTSIYNLPDASMSVITGNHFKGRNSGFGLQITGTSDNLTMTGNIFTNHGTGLYIGSNSTGHTVTGNTFFGNTTNITNLDTTTSTMFSGNGGVPDTLRQAPVAPSLLTRLSRRQILGAMTPPTTTGQGAYSTNTTYFMPHIFDTARTITSAQIYVPTAQAGTTALVAVYSHSDTKGADAVIGAYTSFDCSTTGMKTNAVTWNVPAGIVWFAFRINGTTAQINRYIANSMAGTYAWTLLGNVNSASNSTSGTYQITEAYSTTFNTYTGSESIAIGNQPFPLVSVLY